MIKWMRRTTVLMVMAALLLAPMAATAAENGTSTEGGPGAMTADVVLARPLGIAATAVGTAVFVVSLPFRPWAATPDRPPRPWLPTPSSLPS